jgi:hypothetical protein
VNDNNGYYSHDDGTDDQCAGIGAASVTITIRNHSKVPAGVKRKCGNALGEEYCL